MVIIVVNQVRNRLDRPSRQIYRYSSLGEPADDAEHGVVPDAWSDRELDPDHRHDDAKRELEVSFRDERRLTRAIYPLHSMLMHRRREHSLAVVAPVLDALDDRASGFFLGQTPVRTRLGAAFYVIEVVRRDDGVTLAGINASELPSRRGQEPTCDLASDGVIKVDVDQVTRHRAKLDADVREPFEFLGAERSRLPRIAANDLALALDG